MKYFNYSKRDIRSLSVFYQICNILAVIPPYNFEKSTVIRSIWKKIQGLLLITAISTVTAYSMYLRQDFHAKVYTVTHVALDYLGEFFVVMLALSAIFNSCFCNQESWLKLNNDFQFIDEILENRDVKERNVLATTSVQLFLYLTLYFLGVVCLLYVWSQELGIMILKAYTMHQYCSLYNVLLNFLIYSIALGLKCRYEDLNKLLELKDNDEKETTISLRKIGNISQQLTEIVDLVNKIFGTTLIFITGYSIVQILTSLNFLIYEFKSDSGSHQEKIFLSNSCVVIFTLISISMVMIACDSATMASETTVGLCYKLQERFATNSEIRTELFKLAQQVNNNVVKITAANFFQINKATLFGTLGTTTTYFIIILQFNQSLTQK